MSEAMGRPRVAQAGTLAGSPELDADSRDPPP
jgi:hypothetical protein